jgi:lipopolysaccharide/colanic/teichoic acid biosynthesis glycosyltransferase
VLRVHAPTSKSHLRTKIAVSDIFWVTISPIVALALRDPYLLAASGFPAEISAAHQYVLVTILVAIPSLLFFRVSEGLGHLFSVQDALAVCAAVATAVASSSLFLFVFTRLEGVPRSTPVIYGLVLAAGLLIDRAAATILHGKSWKGKAREAEAFRPQNLRRVIIIGADRFSALTIKLLDHQRPRTTQAIAALDTRPALLGRSICGVKVVGLLRDLERVLEEYAVHGVDVDEVWLSDELRGVSTDVAENAGEFCESRGIKFARISEALNLAPLSIGRSHIWRDAGPTTDLGDYFKLKRIIDIFGATILLIALMPLALAAAYLVLLDVGAPMIFWQQRVGRNGRKFLLYKFRTYHAPFDKRGARIPDEQRLSKIGNFVRAARLDEIPQLLNVLVGDMSLIGPRPLLPQDQPTDPSARLLVRPGITGWAQLNGGTIVSPSEKDALDVWYIRHASLRLDLKIAANTVLFAFTGEKMNHTAVEQALRWRGENLDACTRTAIAGSIHSGRPIEIVEGRST